MTKTGTRRTKTSLAIYSKQMIREAVLNDRPISAESTSSIWEPFGLTREWAEQQVHSGQGQAIAWMANNIITGWENFGGDEVVQLRYRAEEIGVNIGRLPFELKTRQDLFRSEARHALHEKKDLKEALGEAMEAWCLTPDEADLQVEVAMDERDRHENMIDAFAFTTYTE